MVEPQRYFVIIYFSQNIKKDGMRGIFERVCEDRTAYRFRCGSPEGRNSSVVLDTDERLILNWILRKENYMDFNHLAQDRDE